MRLNEVQADPFKSRRQDSPELKRARSMGFYTRKIWYHGTPTPTNSENPYNAPFTKFDFSRLSAFSAYDAGIYCADDISMANGYGGYVFPLYLRYSKKAFNLDREWVLRSHHISQLKTFAKKRSVDFSFIIKEFSHQGAGNTGAQFRLAVNNLVGPDGTRDLMINYLGYSSFQVLYGTTKVVIVLNINDVKHIRARFNRSDTGNIFS